VFDVEGEAGGGGMVGGLSEDVGVGAGAGVLRLFIGYRVLDSQFGVGIALGPVGVTDCSRLWLGGT
jgi:hypothetical protein